MKRISNKKLALNSLLAVLGILSMPYAANSYIIIVPILTCFIGGISFGILLKRTLNKRVNIR